MVRWPYDTWTLPALIEHRECTSWWAADLDLLPDEEIEFPAARTANLDYARAQLDELDAEIARRQRVSHSKYAPNPAHIPERDPDLWRKIKDGFDLKEFIAYHVIGLEFSRAGHNWKTSCPFGRHPDTDPSFFIFPDDHYHCFGCSAHGSVIDFAMDLYSVDFPQAVDILIEAANGALIFRGDFDLLKRLEPDRPPAPAAAPRVNPRFRRTKQQRIIRRDGTTTTSGR